MAIYANREDIKAYIDKKRLERRLREGPKQRRKRHMVSRHFDNGDDDLYDKSDSNIRKQRDSDEYTLHEMSRERDYDQTSVTSSFDLGESVSYYTSGVSSSTANGPYRLRRRGGPFDSHYYEEEPPQYEFHVPRSRTNSVSMSDISTEPSLVYSRRSSVSDSSWVRPSSSIDSESELATPIASDISTEDDYQSLLHISEDDSSSYQLRRLHRAHA